MNERYRNQGMSYRLHKAFPDDSSAPLPMRRQKEHTANRVRFGTRSKQGTCPYPGLDPNLEPSVHTFLYKFASGQAVPFPPAHIAEISIGATEPLEDEPVE
jgi:hypothetical protein